MNPEHNKVEPKDVFFHLLSMVTLYGSAVSFLTIVFQCLNIWLPDPLETFGWSEVYHGPLRFAIASFFVLFPVYFFTAKKLKGTYETSPEKSELRIRKWLVYLTLFIAALVIIGDLVALINNFLSGELSPRFLLKVLAVLFVAGSIFGYYLLGLKDSRKPSMRLFTTGVPLVLIIFLIIGVITVGSPLKERDRQYDARRVNDLQYLQSQINEYFAKVGSLPTSLGNLEDPLRGVYVPKDPETGADYGYEKDPSSPESFSLCASFKLKSEEGLYQSYGASPETFFKHEAGEQCFKRTIDVRFITEKQNLPVLKTINTP